MRILTGIQPSGALHLGNYFGAMRPAIELQKQGEAFYFIANYHSMTSLTDPQLRRQYTLDVALDFLACGLDPARCVFWVQSDVPEVAELAWLLSTVTPMGLLERCHSFKDKVAKLGDGEIGSVNHGLFAYPVLMAADILAFDSNIVPVGKDQKQHLEVTRDIAGKFNQQYGQTFVIPEPRIREEGAAVPGLDGQKMSKSYDNTIPIFDAEKPMRKKIMGIVTDSSPVEAPKDPSVSTIVALYRLFAGEADVEKMEADFRAGGVGYGDFKKRLFDALWEYFRPMREKRAALAADPTHVDGVLASGAARAHAVASATMERVRRAVGLR